RRSVRRDSHRDRARARARRKTGHQRRARSALAAGVQSRQASLRRARNRGTEAGGVRFGLRRLGDVGAGVAVRQVPAGFGEDFRVAGEGDARSAAGESTGLSNYWYLERWIKQLVASNRNGLRGASSTVPGCRL